MNSSILHIAQTLLALWALGHTAVLWCQFGFPRDTVRVLAALFMGSLTLMLLSEALAWWGVFVVFYYPGIYAMLLGVMGLAWPAFIWLGVLDQPTQLQRKIMWRLPILGALLGHGVGLVGSAPLFALGWLTGLGLLLSMASQQRFVLRIMVGQLVVAVLYAYLLRAGQLLMALACFALWVVFTHRIVNAFLVKNSLRHVLKTEGEGVLA